MVFRVPTYSQLTSFHPVSQKGGRAGVAPMRRIGCSNWGKSGECEDEAAKSSPFSLSLSWSTSLYGVAHCLVAVNEQRTTSHVVYSSDHCADPRQACLLWHLFADSQWGCFFDSSKTVTITLPVPTDVTVFAYRRVCMSPLRHQWQNSSFVSRR